MQKKFLSSLFLILLLNLLVKPFFIFGIDAEVQNRVGEADYGNYFALLNFSFLFNILLDLGISNYNTRNISQHPQLVIKHFYKILGLRIVLFSVYAIFTLVAGFLIGYKGFELHLLAILAINQFFVAVIQFSRSNLGGLHMFRADAIISVLDRLLLIVFCSVMLWTTWLGYDFSVEEFVYLQTLAYAITALVSIVIVGRQTGRIKFDLQKNFSVVILRHSFPYAVLILLMMLYSRLDVVMLERLLPNGDVLAGMYAQGYRYLDAVNMFALLFAGMLLPVFARQIKIKGPVLDYLELAIRMLITAAIIIAALATFFSQQLFELVYDHVNEASLHSFEVLIWSFIPCSLTYIFGTLLTANGNLRYLVAMAFGGLVLNLCLNLWLIPRYQLSGAVHATLITQSVTAIAQVVMVYTIFRFRMNWLLFGALFLLGAGMPVVYSLLKNHLDAGVLSLVILTVGLILAFVFRLFRFGDIRDMLSFRQAEK